MKRNRFLPVLMLVLLFSACRQQDNTQTSPLPERQPGAEESVPAEESIIDPLEEAARVAISDAEMESEEHHGATAASEAAEEEFDEALPVLQEEPFAANTTEDKPELLEEAFLENREADKPEGSGGPASEAEADSKQRAPAAESRSLPAGGLDIHRIQAELLLLINQAREKEALPALKLDEKIQFAADIRAEETLESLSHTRPNGTPYHTVFDEAGFSYAGKWHGENLAVIQTGVDLDSPAIAAALFEEWKKSPGHEQNLLGENFAQSGIGVYVHREDEIYHIGAAQLFAGL